MFRKKTNLGITYLFSIYHLLYCNYSHLGPYDVESTSGVITLSQNLSTQYTLFDPIDAPAAANLILTHGFSRDMSVMSDFAQHYASWGIRVSTMNLLHSSIFDNDPILDAIDLNILSEHISLDEGVIYVGQSAGAMRSIVAAAQDSNAIAVFGLDLVDVSSSEWGDIYLAFDYASNLNFPIWGLMGEPSGCNSYGNGLSVYEEAEYGNAVIVSEADHCDFESPTNVLCTIFCEESNNLYSDEDIHDVILSLSTAFFLWQSGLNNQSHSIWYPGNNYYDSLNSSGAIIQMTELRNTKDIILPRQPKLMNNFPNPFNPSTNVLFNTWDNKDISIKIYDLRGRMVRNLFSGIVGVGMHKMEWDGKDDFGRFVSAGIYIYRLKTDSYYTSKKMIMLK